jgi:hypothetical protein
VPDLQFPLIHGKPRLVNGCLRINGRDVAVNRGTPALLAAAIRAAEWLNGPEIYAFLVGDIGRGDGSRALYQFLERHLSEFDFCVLTFHYLQPDVDWHNRVLFAVDAMAHRPILIADAGFMYAAKMSGQAASYDLFTPDRGELAFLADEMAPHPFYTRGFILHQHNDVPDLIRRTYKHRNGAAYLMVKGKTDYLANKEKVIASVASPAFGSMEAIGGTGDTLTGLLTVLCGSGFSRADAAIAAARANRWSGHYADPNPATQIAALIDKIPQALSKTMDEYQKENNHDGHRKHTPD